MSKNFNQKYSQGMTPIAKIEIEIKIRIRNWKIIYDLIAIVDSRSRDLFYDFLKVFMQYCNLKTQLHTYHGASEEGANSKVCRLKK